MQLNHHKLVTLLSSIFVAISISSCNSNSNSEKSNNFGTLGGSGQKTNVTNQSWSYTYNNLNLLETSKDPNGNVTRFDYDAQGNLTKVTNPLKQSLSFGDYDSKGNPQTITDPNGVVTKLSYNTDGLLDSSTTDGSTVKIQYDEVGNVKQMSMPDGSIVNYAYDGANYLTEISSQDGTIKYTRDNAGNITGTEISGSSGLAYADQRIYDEINRLIKVTTAVSTISYSYDNDDNLQASTDGRNNKTSFAYDELQRLTQVTDAKNGSTKYTYNNSQNIDNPDSVTDAKGSKTLYEYNGVGNLLQLASPDSGTDKFTAYDGNGNLLEQRDARGNTISYTYDALDRPKTIDYADPNENTIFTYDNGTNAIGRLTKVQNGVSSNSYSYDARGNTLTETQRINNTDYTVRYAYDKADNLTNIVYPSGTQLVYSYTNGNISKVSVNSRVVADITHAPFGSINQISFGNGVTENINYNTDYSIKQILLSNGLLDHEYSYYPNGEIKSISGVGNYDYDQLGALTKADNDSYDYDKVSNRTTQTVGGAKTDYTIEATSNRLLSSTFNSVKSDYQYDAAGNLIKDADKSYSYDNLNRLKTVSQNSKELANYQYNSFSQRIMKDVNGNKTIFIYNSAGQLLEERNLAQNVTKDYIYADGQLIGLAENGQIVYIVTDHLNAPQIVMDQSGKSIWSAKYDPFGKVTITGNYKLNVRTDGQYQDEETGLYYNWYRYYSPSLGRYITSDPVGMEAGVNTYIYVNGSPINITDPMGLYSWSEFGQDSINFSAGALDNLTFGASGWALGKAGLGKYIDKCAGLYTAGSITGGITSLFLGGYGGWKLALRPKKIADKLGIKSTVANWRNAVDYSHWIPGRVLGKLTGNKNLLYGSPLNGNYVSRIKHALTDPSRYNTMPVKDFKKEYGATIPTSPFFQQYNRIPLFYRGVATGGGSGWLSYLINKDCECQK